MQKKIYASGVFSLYRVVNGVKELILTRSNEVLLSSNYILANLLGKNSAANITSISVFLSGSLVCRKAIATYTYPTNPAGVCTATFQTTFVESDFNGSFDTAFLDASDPVSFDPFAQFFFDSPILKNNTQQYSITWNITFNPPS